MWLFCQEQQVHGHPAILLSNLGTLQYQIMTYASLPALPFELWGYIGSHLSNADIKTFRLACSQFNNAVFLRIDRVFLSANPLNIKVFRSIASHDQFRRRVTEIVWDEARLPRGPQRIWENNEGHELLSDEDEPVKEWAKDYIGLYVREQIFKRHDDEEEYGCPLWFKIECDKNRREMRSRKSSDVDRPLHIACREQLHAEPPLKECWQHYQHLLRQQKDVLAGKSDQEAFLYSVKQFTALKRVTITPAAHGHLFAPLYPTPMIRAFPKGFNYPIPRGWLYPKTTTGPANAYRWNEYPKLRERYRGFRTVMHVLANEPNSVSELVITSNLVSTGINCTIFDDPCEEYDNLATVLKAPGFRRLDVSLLMGCFCDEDIETCWRSLSNGRLCRALSEAKELEEFRLHLALREDIEEFCIEEEYSPIPLRSIVPVEKWPKLRHFELSGFLVSQDDIVSFLATLPKPVSSIELSIFEFLDGNWYDVLEDIRRMIRENELWGERDIASRPKLTIGIPLVNQVIGRGIFTEKEVHDFIYGDAKNPFLEDSRCHVPFGIGIQKDIFDPSFERPNLNTFDLAKLNICRGRAGG